MSNIISPILHPRFSFPDLKRRRAGSAAEVRSLFYVVEDNYPAARPETVALRNEAIAVGKLVSGLIRSTEKRKVRRRVLS